MTKQEHLEKIAEIAGCLTNMSLIEVVDYKSKHPTLKYDWCGYAFVRDPVMEKYRLVEEQIVPVFMMLKQAVDDYLNFKRKSEIEEGEMK